MSLEQLMNVEITSVGKKRQPLSRAPAAIYVITQEDIRRSGMSTVPDLLRMVPGLDVAQSDARHWAISARGFSDIYSNKLLVLIDGRTIYTPSFSGVLWDVQDLPLEDVERIEVIRGPGGTIWGANAVNGVINIITKSAGDTQGFKMSGGGGATTFGEGLAEYGGRFAQDGYFRVYLKGFNRNDSLTTSGLDAGDSWEQGRIGTRADWAPTDKDSLTLQGEYFRQRMNNVLALPSLTGPTLPSAVVQNDNGGHALLNWSHSFSSNSDIDLQGYFDRLAFQDATGELNLDTYDVEFRHHLQLGSRHEIVWGGGYRRVNYAAQNNFYITLTPPNGAEEVFNVFGQDEFALLPRLHLIAGIKVEHNTYTGWENEPSLRLIWTPSDDHTIWAAVSRAIRTPSIGEEFIRFNLAAAPATPPFPAFLVASVGNPALRSEEEISWEAGYRGVLGSRLRLDVAGFYNRYSRLTSFSFGAPFLELDPAPPHLVIPLPYGNALKGESWGGEASLTWQATKTWRLSASYSLLLGHIRSTDPAIDPAFQRTTLGRSPKHQAQLRSQLDLPGHFELDGAVYYVSRLPADAIPAYTRVDLRLGWRPIDHLEISLSGQNLLQGRHPEFSPISFAAQSEVPRAVFVKATVGF